MKAKHTFKLKVHFRPKLPKPFIAGIQAYVFSDKELASPDCKPQIRVNARCFESTSNAFPYAMRVLSVVGDKLFRLSGEEYPAVNTDEVIKAIKDAL